MKKPSIQKSKSMQRFMAKKHIINNSVMNYHHIRFLKQVSFNTINSLRKTMKIIQIHAGKMEESLFHMLYAQLVLITRSQNLVICLVLECLKVYRLTWTAEQIFKFFRKNLVIVSKIIFLYQLQLQYWVPLKKVQSTTQNKFYP